MTRRRVVITGLGCLTPAGNDARSTWESLLAGRNSIAVVSQMVEYKLHSQIGGELKGFDPERIGSKQDMRRIARGTQMVLAATTEAWRDAGFAAAPPNLGRTGVYVGTGVGDMGETVKESKGFNARGARGIHPLFVARVMLNAAPAHVSLEFGLRGPSVTTCSACSAGGHALGLALRLIQCGDADVMLAGGMEEMSCIFMSASFDNIRALSTRNENPEKASRPFDRKRDGFVISEGAAFVVLEDLEHAKKRGARILAELAGFGQASDAYHITAPEPNGEGAILAMKAALADAGLRPEDVQHVNAHGTSTPLNDKMETAAMKRVFGDHAKKLAISGTKSMIGHSVGASSAIALVATVLAMRDGRVHGTMNYEEPDPDCDLDYVPNASRELDVKAAMVNAFGFGGHCISLIVRRFA